MNQWLNSKVYNILKCLIICRDDIFVLIALRLNSSSVVGVATLGPDLVNDALAQFLLSLYLRLGFKDVFIH